MIDREAAKQAFELKGARLHLPGIGGSVIF